MTKPVRRIKKFDFEKEGAHVALVDTAANGQSVLTMKSLRASDEEIQKALSNDVTVKMNIMEFLTRYLNMWYEDAEVVAGLLGYSADDLHGEDAMGEPMTFVEYIQAQMDKVELQKSEHKPKLEEAFETFKSKHLDQESPSSVEKGDGESDVKPTDDKEETTQMTTENTQKEAPENTELSIEEQIQKAAERLAETQMEEVRKREEKMQRELDILKAEQSAQRHAKFVAKAESLKTHLGEEADVEALAKALEAASADETLSPLVKALEGLSDTAENSDKLEEVGKSGTREQELDSEAKVEQLQKSLMDKDGLSESAAYTKAYEEVHGV